MKTNALVALVVALIAAAPLTYPGPLQTHNGFTPLYALMGDALAAPQVGALPLVLATALVQLGAAPLDALKSVDALAFALGALGMFLLARRWYGDAAGLATSALYSLLPYRLMTTYVRGESGEALFLGLLPLLLWLTAGRRRQTAVGGQRSAVARIILLAIITLDLWKLCVPYAPDPSQAQVYLFQIFSARWEYGNRGDWLDAVPLQLGTVPVGLSIIALLTRPDRFALKLAVIAAIAGLLSIAPFSAWWPWAWLLNAPWQLLGIAGFCLSLLGGSLVARDERMATLPALATVMTLTMLASYVYLAPRGLDFTPTHPPLARYGNEAYLVDAAISPTLKAGATIMVTLWWQDIAPFDDDDTVFVHVIDPQGKIWAQRDAQPLHGARPTYTWQRGELLRDDYVVDIPANAPSDLRIEVGLYRSDSGERVRTTNGDDRVLIKP